MAPFFVFGNSAERAAVHYFSNFIREPTLDQQKISKEKHGRGQLYQLSRIWSMFKKISNVDFA